MATRSLATGDTRALALRGSRKLAEKFRDANAFGYAPGARTGIVLVDIDDKKYGIERVEEEFGTTPVVIKTPGGHHLAYRHRGESRRIRPYPDKPIDIIGGGYVVAPPSRVAKGEYEIVRGSLQDPKNLPPLAKFLDGIRWSKMREGDGRYVAMRHACQREVRYVDSYEDLADWATTHNQDFASPLSDVEVQHAVDWAWTVQQEGRNWAGQSQRITVEAASLKLVMSGGPDAVFLLMDLKAHHWGHKRFVIATRAMVDRYGLGFTRLRRARDALAELGIIKLIDRATPTRPATYAWA
jgi:Bifunctional DNA primase/polymerase, N-terminal